MKKIVVEHKLPELYLGSTPTHTEKIKLAEHEVDDFDNSIAFREGNLVIIEKSGRIVGYSPYNYIRFWTEEVTE